MYLVFAALPIFLNVFLMPVRTRYLSPQEYGVFGALIGVMALMASLCGMGLGSAVSSYFHDKRHSDEDNRVLFGSTWTLVAMVTACFSFLFAVRPEVLFAISGVSGGTSEILLSRWVAVGLFCEVVFVLQVQNLFRVMEVAQVVGLISVVSITVASVCSVTLLVAGMGLEGQIIGFMLGHIAAAFCASIVVRRYGHGFRFSRNMSVKALRFGLPLLPHILTFWVLATSCRLIVARTSGEHAVGQLTIAIGIASLITVLVSSLSEAIYPRAHRMFHNETLRVARQAMDAWMNLWLYVVGILSLLFSSASRIMVNILAANEFEAAGLIVPSLVAGTILMGTYQFAVFPLYLRRKTRMIPVFSGVASLLYFALAFTFGSRFGVQGVTVSMAVAYGLMCMMFHLYSRSVEDVYQGWRKKIIFLVCLTISHIALPAVEGFWPYFGVGIGLSFILLVLFYWTMCRGQLGPALSLLVDSPRRSSGL